MTVRKTMAVIAGLALAGAIGLGGCTGGNGPGAAATQAITDAANHAPATISVWVFNKLPTEVDAIQASMDRLRATYPWLTINLVTAKDDTAFAQAVTAGNPPDVFVTASPTNVAKFCFNGTVIDMNRLIQSAGLDMAATFPDFVLPYTQYQGQQCALPLLTDAYALYYNKAMFAAAGITDPPKTLSDLTADIKRLTIRDANGTITQWGMTPPRDDYGQTDSLFAGGQTGAQFYDANGKATMATDPTWAELLTWQKDLLDWYGQDQVQSFVATYSSHTDDAQNPFVTGVSAMEFDGEWHIGEVDANAPDLDYGVAPMAVPDSRATVYGAGNLAGTVVMIPAGSKQQDVAFLAVQQLTTDTEFLTSFASAMSNVPTTFASLSTWEGAADPKWKTFIDMANDPNSYWKSLTPAGQEDVDTWNKFIQQWEVGQVPDLPTGLSQIAANIDDLNQQAVS